MLCHFPGNPCSPEYLDYMLKNRKGKYLRKHLHVKEVVHISQTFNHTKVPKKA